MARWFGDNVKADNGGIAAARGAHVQVVHDDGGYQQAKRHMQRNVPDGICVGLERWHDSLVGHLAVHLSQKFGVNLETGREIAREYVRFDHRDFADHDEMDAFVRQATGKPCRGL